MRRREFIELFFLAATGWPHAASAQTSPRISRIAVLMPYGEGETSNSIRSAFEHALRDLGWIDGRNVRIEYRLAGGDFGRLRSFAKEAVKLQPDVIVALNTPLVAAVLDETRSIPVVSASYRTQWGAASPKATRGPAVMLPASPTEVAALRANGLNCSRNLARDCPGRGPLQS